MKRFYDFDWDEQNEDHITQHRVTADEVEQCFFNPHWLRKKPKSNRRYYFYGRTDGGRYLFIVFDDLGGATVRPVTALDMDEREKSLYTSTCKELKYALENNSRFQNGKKRT